MELMVGAQGSLGEVRLGPFADYTESDPDFGVFTSLVHTEEQFQAGLRFSGVRNNFV